VSHEPPPARFSSALCQFTATVIGERAADLVLEDAR